MDKKFTNEKIINVAKCCITGNCKSCPLENDEKCATNFLNCVIEYMENEFTPATDVQEVKRGYWIPERDPDENNRIQCFHCSVCDDDFHYIGAFVATKYCPNCGARMEEFEE